MTLAATTRITRHSGHFDFSALPPRIPVPGSHGNRVATRTLNAFA